MYTINDTMVCGLFSSPLVTAFKVGIEPQGYPAYDKQRGRYARLRPGTNDLAIAAYCWVVFLTWCDDNML